MLSRDELRDGFLYIVKRVIILFLLGVLGFSLLFFYQTGNNPLAVFAKSEPEEVIQETILLNDRTNIQKEFSELSNIYPMSFEDWSNNEFKKIIYVYDSSDYNQEEYEKVEAIIKDLVISIYSLDLNTLTENERQQFESLSTVDLNHSLILSENKKLNSHTYISDGISTRQWLKEMMYSN